MGVVGEVVVVPPGEVVDEPGEPGVVDVDVLVVDVLDVGAVLDVDPEDDVVAVVDGWWRTVVVDVVVVGAIVVVGTGTTDCVTVTVCSGAGRTRI